MKNTRKTQAMIKKLNMIYKKGYLPARERKRYSELHAKAVNCFGHACFNLSNNDLKKLEPYLDELKDFFRNFDGCGLRNYLNEAETRIKKVGLKIESSSIDEHMQKNQWKIAYYIMNNASLGNDIHFMIQGKNGKWTSKAGSLPNIQVFDKLPKIYNDDYSLVGIYKITNPYAKLKEEEMEM